mmetsp:Transcript_11311/g.37214  ORF Transcript_11311/g.37214 Transcript_11311/m.37214 type:complete len:205 (-) Transcript_11311:811-1425(-)
MRALGRSPGPIRAPTRCLMLLSALPLLNKEPRSFQVRCFGHSLKSRFFDSHALAEAAGVRGRCNRGRRFLSGEEVARADGAAAENAHARRAQLQPRGRMLPHHRREHQRTHLTENHHAREHCRWKPLRSLQRCARGSRSRERGHANDEDGTDVELRLLDDVALPERQREQRQRQQRQRVHVHAPRERASAGLRPFRLARVCRRP